MNPPLLLFLLLSAKPATEVTTSALSALSDSASSLLGLVGQRVGDTAERSAIRSLVVLAATLCAVGTLLRCHVADWLEETTLADLTSDSVRHAALELVDGLDTSDLGFVKLLCKEVSLWPSEVISQ